MDVLYSMRPEWCKLILEGKKTGEVRKSLPRALFDKHGVSPFVGHIYCTQGGQALFRNIMSYRLYERKYIDHYLSLRHELLNGKVVASFSCWRIVPINRWYLKQDIYERVHFEETCIPYDDLIKYMNGGDAYEYQISELFIYKKPLTLADFNLKRAPQSWCYVERRILNELHPMSTL